MKRYLAASLLCALLIGSAYANTCVPLQAGATDQTVYVEFIDATTGVPNASLAFNSSGIDLEYVRSGAAATDITEATQTAAGAHSDGGFVSVGHGRYRLDLPDAAVATGVPQVVIQGTVTGYILLPCVVALSPPTNVVRFGGADGTFASGRPEVNTTHAAGTAWNSGAIGANTLASDTITAAKAAADLTTELQAGLATSSALTTVGTNVSTLLEALVVLGAEQTADSGTTTTLVDAALTQATDGWFNGMAVHFTSGTLLGQASCVTGFTASSDTVTFSPAVTTAVTTHTYYLLPDAECATGDAFGRIGAAGAGLTNIDLPNQTMDITGTISGSVGSIASGGITDSSFATTTGELKALGITRQGTAQAATGTTVTLDASAPFGDNTNIGSTLWVKGSTNGNYWQPCSVTAYVASTKVATVSCPSGFVTPTGTITYQLFGTASGGGDVNVTTIEGTDATDYFATLDDTTLTRLPAALVSGRMDASVGAMASDVITDAASAASFETRLQTEAEDAINARLEQQTRADAAIINCEVNTATFAGSTTTVACILTDRDAGAITAASNDLEGRELLILSGAQIYEGRFITDTTWDGANSELRLTLSRALPGTLADAVTAIIR